MRQSLSSGEASYARFVTGLKSLHNRTDLKQKIKALAEALTDEEADFLLHDWQSWARPEQLPPQDNWSTWLFMGGRGAGKTRAGAEWVRSIATGPEPSARIALIGETLNDTRDVMVEGESGILAVHRRDERPVYEKTRGRLVWPNGAQAQIFSADVPDSLRGPQFHAAWADEIAKWRYMQDAFDNLQFGLRLGKHPRQMITTTPRNLPLLKKLAADKRNVVTRATTQANAGNLPQVFIEEIMSRYGGTRLGRQELDGEIIDDRNDALWTRQMIDTARVAEAPQMTRIVVAVDPAVTSHEKSDACGIIAAGTGEDGHAYLLEDGTLRAVRPDIWAGRAIAMYQRLQADCLVVEVNQGGDMIASVINAIDSSVPVKNVRATRGKWLRAEPVAALYSKQLIHHVGNFSALEDEMCDFGNDGLSGGRSPDRLDALVWAVTALKLDAAKPLIRRL